MSDAFDAHTAIMIFRTTQRQASQYTDPDAQRGVWRGAAFSRRLAAAAAKTPDEYRWQMELVDAYERAERLVAQ